MDNSIITATESGGGLMLASFGSGDEGGNLQRRAQGRARTQNASAGEVRAVRTAINRSNLSARRKRLLAQEIQDNSTRNGIRRGLLADIRDALNG